MSVSSYGSSCQVVNPKNVLAPVEKMGRLELSGNSDELIQSAR